MYYEVLVRKLKYFNELYKQCDMLAILLNNFMVILELKGLINHFIYIYIYIYMYVCIYYDNCQLNHIIIMDLCNMIITL